MPKAGADVGPSLRPAHRRGAGLLFGLVGRRLVLAVPVLVVASALSFVFVRLTIDPLASVRADTDPAAVVRERHHLGLDRPLGAQYATWLGSFVRGDWGEGLTTHRSVAGELRQAIGYTTQLVVWASVLSAVVAVAVGVIGALRRGTAADHVLGGLAVAGVSMPLFWFALVAIEVVVFMPRRYLHLDQPLLYSVGLGGTTGGGVVDYVRHAALPVLTLSVPLVARWSRYQRAALLDVLSAPYVQTARAKGAGRAAVLRHALRNALLPLTTVMAADIGHLLGGVIVVETIFAWPGMGQLLHRSLLNGDTNVVLPWLMIAGGFVVAANLAADVLHRVLDPRVRS